MRVLLPLMVLAVIFPGDVHAEKVARAQQILAPRLAELVRAKPKIEVVELDKKRHCREGLKGLRMAFYVNATAEKTMSMLWDFRRFSEIFPAMKNVDMRWQKPHALEAEVTVQIILTKLKYTLRRFRDADKRKVRWNLINGDFKCMTGSWQVFPTEHPEVSKIVFVDYVDIGFFVPDSLYVSIAMSMAGATPKRLRDALAKRK